MSSVFTLLMAHYSLFLPLATYPPVLSPFLLSPMPLVYLWALCLLVSILILTVRLFLTVPRVVCRIAVGRRLELVDAIVESTRWSPFIFHLPLDRLIYVMLLFCLTICGIIVSVTCVPLACRLLFVMMS